MKVFLNFRSAEQFEGLQMMSNEATTLNPGVILLQLNAISLAVVGFQGPVG